MASFPVGLTQDMKATISSCRLQRSESAQKGDQCQRLHTVDLWYRTVLFRGGPSMVCVSVRHQVSRRTLWHPVRQPYCVEIRVFEDELKNVLSSSSECRCSCHHRASFKRISGPVPALASQVEPQRDRDNIPTTMPILVTDDVMSSVTLVSIPPRTSLPIR